jgi:hypothetical protein
VLPVVEGSDWIFYLPPNTVKRIFIFSDKMDFSYGTYEVRFKTSGLRLSNAAYDPLWFRKWTSETYQELDIMETFGSYAPNKRSTSINTGTGVTMDNISWAGSRIFDSNVMFEDGAYHVLKAIVTPTSVKQYMDGILDYEWTPPPNLYAKPPWQLIVDADNPVGNNSSDWILWVDWIKYWKE